MIFLVFHTYYILAHILQIFEERKKILTALLISYSASLDEKLPSLTRLVLLHESRSEKNKKKNDKGKSFLKILRKI